MKKQELIDDVAKRTGAPKADVRAILDAAGAAIIDALARGEDVFVLGLGKLSTRRRSEKVARNLHTGERVVVPPRTVTVYRASDTVEAAVNGRRVTDVLTTGD